MDAKTTQEQQLREEIRWAKEAHLIADNCSTSPEILEAHQQQIPISFRHLANNMDCEQLEEHISRLEKDLEDLQSGEWE